MTFMSIFILIREHMLFFITNIISTNKKQLSLQYKIQNNNKKKIE